MESAGELFLVRMWPIGNAAEVYRVDVEREVLEYVYTIGHRLPSVIFLGPTRCLSVDVEKFPLRSIPTTYTLNLWCLMILKI